MAPRGDNASADNGHVLTPEELDITDNENVVEIDDGRYVVASDGDGMERAISVSQTNPQSDELSASEADDSESTNSPSSSSIDMSELQEVDARYGFHVAAKAGDTVGEQQMYSDDIGTVFDALIMWYGQQLDRRTPLEDVLGILLAESNIRIRYPERALHAFMDGHELKTSDSIADLIMAIRDDDGLVFPANSGTARNRTKD